MKVNILYVNHTGEIGGAEVSLLLLLRNLNRALYQPVVVCPLKGSLAKELAEISVTFQEIDFHQVRRTLNPVRLLIAIFFFFRHMIRIFQIVRSKNIKLVHANSLKSAIISGIGARLDNVPLVWHVRDFLPVGFFRQLFTRLAYLLATKVIVNSKAVGEIFRFLQKDPNEKVKIIYNCIDPDLYNPDVDGNDLRRELNIGTNIALIGFIGRVHPEKGIEYLIRAVREVIKIVPEVRLLIVGDTALGKEEYQKRMRDLSAELGLADRILFLGYRKEVVKIMAALDILVLPSLREPFGLVSLEAMAMKKPVIATNTGGSPEVIIDGKTGLLVAPRDSCAISSAIIKLLKDKELARRMGATGRKRVMNFFSPESTISSVQEMYDKILKNCTSNNFFAEKA